MKYLLIASGFVWISACAYNANESVKISKISGSDNMHRISLNGQNLGDVKLGRNTEFSAIANDNNSWIVVFDGAREGADSYPNVLIYKNINSNLKPAEQFNFLEDLRIQDVDSMTEMQFLHFDDNGNPVVYSTHGKEVTITE